MSHAGDAGALALSQQGQLPLRRDLPGACLRLFCRPQPQARAAGRLPDSGWPHRFHRPARCGMGGGVSRSRLRRDGENRRPAPCDGPRDHHGRDHGGGRHHGQPPPRGGACRPALRCGQSLSQHQRPRYQRHLRPALPAPRRHGSHRRGDRRAAILRGPAVLFAGQRAADHPALRRGGASAGSAARRNHCGRLLRRWHHLSPAFRTGQSGNRHRGSSRCRGGRPAQRRAKLLRECPVLCGRGGNRSPRAGLPH